MTFSPVSQTQDGALSIDAAKLTESLPFIEYQDNTLYIDGADTTELAKLYGTPLYVYSKNALLANYTAYMESFSALNDVQICYAVKANSNLAVLSALAKAGAGFDIVSTGELARVIRAGGNPAQIVYSGVGKTASDIHTALEAGVGCFNVEALSELDTINAVAAELGKKAPIALRINPDVDAKTHPYISTGMKDNKFGIAHDVAISAYEYANTLSNLDIVGIDCHIGSQLTEVKPFVDALDKMIELIDELFARGIKLSHVDLGGGLGVRYIDENPASVHEFAEALLPKLLALQAKYGKKHACNTHMLIFLQYLNISQWLIIFSIVCMVQMTSMS